MTSLKLMTRTADESLRKDVFNVLVDCLGDVTVSTYIIEKLVEMNDREARMFHSQLRGAWQLICEDDLNKYPTKDAIRVISPCITRDVLCPYGYYIIRKGYIESCNTIVERYGWKLNTLSSNLIREIEFHSSDNYYGLCLSDRRVNVSKYKYSYEAIAEYMDDGDDERLKQCMISQFHYSLDRRNKNYFEMFNLYYDEYGDPYDFKDSRDYTVPGDIRMVQKYTLGDGYTLWIQCCGFKLNPNDNSYTKDYREWCGDYYNGDHIVYKQTITHTSDTNPYHYYNRKDRYIPCDSSEKDKIVLCSETTYSTKNGMEFYSAMSIDEWPDEDSNDYKHFVGDHEELLEPYLQPFLKERFGFDLHNPVILELFISNLEHLQIKWTIMNDYLVNKKGRVTDSIAKYNLAVGNCNAEWYRLEMWTDIEDDVIHGR